MCDEIELLIWNGYPSPRFSMVALVLNSSFVDAISLLCEYGAKLKVNDGHFGMLADPDIPKDFVVVADDVNRGSKLLASCLAKAEKDSLFWKRDCLSSVFHRSISFKRTGDPKEK